MPLRNLPLLDGILINELFVENVEIAIQINHHWIKKFVAHISCIVETVKCKVVVKRWKRTDMLLSTPQ